MGAASKSARGDSLIREVVGWEGIRVLGGGFTARRCRSGADGGVRPSTSGGAEAYGGEIEFACFGFGYGTAAQ